MTVISIDQRLDALREEKGDMIPLSEVQDVVKSLVSAAIASNEMSSIASELSLLLDDIHSARDELVSIQPKNMSAKRIPEASDELGAVVSATEDAAGVIMNAADCIQEIGDEIGGDHGTKLSDQATQLFEASSFQDLTGQRINKVAKTLSELEDRLAALAEAVGDDFVEPKIEVSKNDDGVVLNDDDLLNGPQMEGQGNSQDEIDALLASFD